MSTSQEMTKVINLLKKEREAEVKNLINIKYSPELASLKSFADGNPLKIIRMLISLENTMNALCNIDKSIETLIKERKSVAYEKYKNTDNGKAKRREASLRWYHKNKNKPKL